MEKHIFDKVSRVPLQQAEVLECETWLPPTVSSSGHLVYAESKSSQRREGGSASESAPAPVPADTSDEAREEGRKRN